MKLAILLFALLLGLNPVFAEDSESSQQLLEEEKSEDQMESPGDLGDDSYAQVETPPHRSGYNNKPNFGSAASIPKQLEEDDRVKAPVIRLPSIDRGLKPWFDRKKELNELLGFQIGIDYNSLYQSTNDSLTDEERFWGGNFRVFGKWELLNKGGTNVGALVFQLGHRHNIYYPLTPGDLPGNIGYIGVTGTNFSDQGAILGDIYWQQKVWEGQGGIIVGRFDPNDFMDVLGYFNPYTTFSNLAIGSNESIALPDWSWGAGAGRWFDDQVYVLGSISDANGTATNEKFFEGGAEFFSQAEIGWSPGKDQRYRKNVHLTLWHVDEREDAGVESSRGLALGANWSWNEKWMAFARAGWSTGSAPISNEAYTIGLGRMFRQWSDVVGIAVNTGSPPDESFKWQTSTELFYRMQLSEHLQLTPSLQYLKNPPLNDETNSVWLFSLRMRLTL